MVLSVTPEPPAHLPIFEKYHRVYANPFVLHKYGYLQKALWLQSWLALYFFDRPEEDRSQATNGTFENPGPAASTRSAGWIYIINWDVQRNELQCTPGLLDPWVRFCAGILPNTWPCGCQFWLKFPLQVLQQAFHISDMALKEGLKKWDFASMKSSSEAWISGSKTRLGCSKLENDETVFCSYSKSQDVDGVWCCFMVSGDILEEYLRIRSDYHVMAQISDISGYSYAECLVPTPQCLVQGPQQKMASTNYGHLGCSLESWNMLKHIELLGL